MVCSRPPTEIGQHLSVSIACPVCGYDLAGMRLHEQDVRCPECGSSHSLRQLARESPELRREAWRVCLAPLLSPIPVIAAMLVDVGPSVFVAMIMPVVAAMVSLLMFAVHATTIELPARSLYRIHLFLIGVLVWFLSTAACVVAAGVAFGILDLLMS